MGVDGVGEAGEVFDDAVEVRLLYDDASYAALCEA